MIEKYLDKARLKLEVETDAQLAHALDVSPAQVCRLRDGSRLPSDALMLQLVELSGESKEVALLELAAARAPSIEVRDVFLNLRNKVFAAFIGALLMLSAGSAQAMQIAAPTRAMVSADLTSVNSHSIHMRFCNLAIKLCRLLARVGAFFKHLLLK